MNARDLNSYQQRQLASKTITYDHHFYDDPTTAIIDNKTIDIEKSAQWKGFICCSDLDEKGITITKSRNCKCKSTDVYQSRTHWKCPNTGEIFKISSKLSCFSMDIIYVISCENCSYFYIGKCGAGVNDKRTFRNRTNEHLNSIKSAYLSLSELGFYDQSEKLLIIHTLNCWVLNQYLKTKPILEKYYILLDSMDQIAI